MLYNVERETSTTFLHNNNDITINNNINAEELRSNIIKDINYTSRDLKGNEYILLAKEGEIDLDNSDIIFLTDVKAYIKLIKNSELIIITSNYGKYNTINYDTIFSKNVIATYPGHKITGELLDFSFVNNIGIFSTNIVYVGSKTKMIADKIEVNLTNNDTKIFMLDQSKKVIIEGIN